ncbi:hypothetical protein SMICM17S_02167 [Streptomyces microflavus]
MRPLLRDLLRNAYEQGGSSDWRDLLRGPEEPELDLAGNEDLLEAATPETYLAVNRYDVPAVRASGPRARETGCCGSPLRRRGGPRAGPVLASYDRNTPADTAPSRSRSNPPARCRHGPTVRGALRADQDPGHTRTSRLRLGRVVAVSAAQGPWEACTTSRRRTFWCRTRRRSWASSRHRKRAPDRDSLAGALRCAHSAGSTQEASQSETWTPRRPTPRSPTWSAGAASFCRCEESAGSDGCDPQLEDQYGQLEL